MGGTLRWCAPEVLSGVSFEKGSAWEQGRAGQGKGRVAITEVTSSVTTTITHIRGLITLGLLVVSRVAVVLMTPVRGRITLRRTTHEPPSQDSNNIYTKPTNLRAYRFWGSGFGSYRA